ncbi:MAG: hypothetical protein ACP5LN_09445 [Thermoproteota archaeon]
MNNKSLLLVAALGLMLTFIAGLAVGSFLSLGELNSIKAQISALQDQVMRLSLESLKSSTIL